MTDFSSTDERGDINICSDSVTFGKGKNKEITCTRLQQDDYILFTVPVGKTAGKTDIDFSVTLTQDPGAEPSEWMAEYWEDGR